MSDWTGSRSLRMADIDSPARGLLLLAWSFHCGLEFRFAAQAYFEQLANRSPFDWRHEIEDIRFADT